MDKIFELAKQADLIEWGTLPSGAQTPDYESVVKAKKFAELIVQECIDCIRGAVLTDEVAVRNNFGYNNGLEEAVINVQKHFRVAK